MSEIGGLKRSILGLTDSYASHLAAQQQQQLSQAQDEAEATHRSLLLEIELLRKRVEILRQSTDMLTQRLVKTRAATGTASHMVEQQMATLAREHAAAIGDLRFESVRVSAELQLERQAFRDFLADLYRVLAGRSALPADLEPSTPPMPRQALPDRPNWEPLLDGKVVSRTVRTSGGQVIAVAGDRVSTDTISAAEQNGKLPELFLAVRAPLF